MKRAIVLFLILILTPVFVQGEGLIYPQLFLACGATDHIYGCTGIDCCENPEYAMSGPDENYAEYRYMYGYADYDLGGWYDINVFYVSTYSGLKCYENFCECFPGENQRQKLFVWYSSDQENWIEGLDVLSCDWDIKPFYVDWDNVRYIRLGRTGGGPGRGNPGVDVFYVQGGQIKQGYSQIHILFLKEKGMFISIFVIVITCILIIFARKKTIQTKKPV